MKKNVLVRLVSALLCVCLIAGTLAGCSGNKAKTDTPSGETVDVSDEKYAGLIDGYDPETDDVNAKRSVSDDVPLAGSVFTINGEKVEFSNSKLVEYTKLSPNKNDPQRNITQRTHKIDTISIHCMAGQLSLETCGNVFADEDAKASSNYGIDPQGRIGMYVEEKDRSWCSSNSENDNRAVTIEVASDSSHPYAVTDKAYTATIRLVADICKRNKIEKLIWSTDKATRIQHKNGANMTVHRDYANKACPGEYLYSRMGDIAKRVNAILKQKTSTTKSEYPYMVKIKASILNVYQNPDGNSAVVTSVKKGEVYSIIEEKKVNSETWGKLKNNVGWINLKDTEKIN